MGFIQTVYPPHFVEITGGKIRINCNKIFEVNLIRSKSRPIFWQNFCMQGIGDTLKYVFVANIKRNPLSRQFLNKLFTFALHH